ncbi:hypothetical protein [Streptosporangium sp. NPDC002607]
MAIELDPDWPGLTIKDDSSGDGGPEGNQAEIERIARALDESLTTLTTPTQPPATSVAQDQGGPPAPLPGPPPGAGSLPDVRLQCAIGSAHMGEWLTAQQFAMATYTAYATLIGETEGSGGLYSSLVQQYDTVVEALIGIARTNTAAEQANMEPGDRRDV